jgi:parallel beta-helix repeat protein
LGIIFLFICTGITPSVAVDTVKKSSMSISNGKTLYVGGSGPNNYTKIQDAIDNASDGDTIYVFSGTYLENVIVDNVISLIGENKTTTIIDGGGKDDVVLIDGEDWATISGFTIQNSGKDIWEDAGIDIRTESNTITGNIIKNNSQHGIYCIGEDYTWFGYNIIFDNIITNNKLGITLDDSFNNEVYENYVVNNDQGIFVGTSTLPLRKEKCLPVYEYYNNVYRNTIINNGCGIMIDHGSLSNIFENTIEKNGEGIFLQGTHGFCEQNSIYHNNILNNTDGIVLNTYWGGGACNNKIYLNNLKNNERGIYISSEWDGICPSYNNISQNNFIGNKINAFLCTQWILLGWNFWSDNYWNRARLLPYIIFGKAGPFGLIPRLQFDWHPVKKPYDIGVLNE